MSQEHKIKPSVAAEYVAQNLQRTAEDSSDAFRRQVASGLAHIILGLDVQGQQLAINAAQISSIEVRFDKFEKQCNSHEEALSKVAEDKRFVKRLMLISGSIATAAVTLLGTLIGTLQTIHDDHDRKIAEEVYADNKLSAMAKAPDQQKPVAVKKP